MEIQNRNLHQFRQVRTEAIHFILFSAYATQLAQTLRQRINCHIYRIIELSYWLQEARSVDSFLEFMWTMGLSFGFR